MVSKCTEISEKLGSTKIKVVIVHQRCAKIVLNSSSPHFACTFSKEFDNFHNYFFEVGHILCIVQQFSISAIKWILVDNTKILASAHLSSHSFKLFPR